MSNKSVNKSIRSESVIYIVAAPLSGGQKKHLALLIERANRRRWMSSNCLHPLYHKISKNSTRRDKKAGAIAPAFLLPKPFNLSQLTAQSVAISCKKDPVENFLAVGFVAINRWICRNKPLDLSQLPLDLSQFNPARPCHAWARGVSI